MVAGDSIRSYSPSYEMEDDQSSECRSKPPSDQPENLSLDGGSFVSSHPDLDRDHAGMMTRLLFFTYNGIQLTNRFV